MMEGKLGLAPAVPEAVPDAEPVTVVPEAVPDAEPVHSGGKPIPLPMESTSEPMYAVPSDQDSESSSMGSAKGSALRRAKTRGDRDLSDCFRETLFSVTVSYIPLNLSK